MAPKKIRAGIVGCGKISHFHIHNIFENKQTAVVGLCDPYQPSIENLRRRLLLPAPGGKHRPPGINSMGYLPECPRRED